MTRRQWIASCVGAIALTVVEGRLLRAQDAAPLIVVETTKGAFAFVTFPEDAPLTVSHIVGLVKSGFYDGQRIHRAIPRFLVQFGDPQTRDTGMRDLWGKGDAASSGHPIGFSEVSKRRQHIAGAVGVAHMGEPAKADSQIYITLSRRPDLDGQYTVFGQIAQGADVLLRLEAGDEIRRVHLRE